MARTAMMDRETGLLRLVPIAVGIASAVLVLILILPVLSEPKPALAEAVLLGLGAVSVVILTGLAIRGARREWRHRDEIGALERRVEDVEIFAIAARHDLREPLRKIIAFGERLRDRLGPAGDDQLDRYAERMSDAATRMRGLLDELAEWSRINDDNTKPSAIATGDLIADLVAGADDALADCQGELAVSDLPDLHADPTQIRTLFDILLANSIQYARPDAALRVRVEGEIRADGFAEIRFHDNGIGFADDKAERIFLPFERLHGRDAYPGTGIGLATARKIAERHGGQLFARGEMGNGAVFTLILPRQKASL